MMKTSTTATISVVLLFVAALSAQQAVRPRELASKYTRDSEEYAALARQTYRIAAATVTRVAPALGQQPWAVVLDVDETALDNSTYELERAAYGLVFENSSWNAWVRRQEAPAVPGTIDFVAAVRRAGGHVAWITNRDAVVADATRENLRSVRLWSDDDRLCAQKNAQHTKRVRRAEVISGSGDCAWQGAPMRVLAFIGDQMSDFPEPDEGIRNAGTDSAFGESCFLLPNSMYGSWTTRVTRTTLTDPR
jgi:5'-nucleotidase (lipoprotein e(P4) family)